MNSILIEFHLSQSFRQKTPLKINKKLIFLILFIKKRRKLNLFEYIKAYFFTKDKNV